MKKLLLLFAVLLSALGISAAVYDFKVDGVCYKKLSDNTCAVTYHEQTKPDYMFEIGFVPEPLSYYAGNVVIPSKVKYNNKTYSVTEIGYCAFLDCKVTSVVIPNSVVKIAGNAFRGCSISESLTMSNSVTEIGSGAFLFSSLKSIELPNTLTYIGSDAFRSCGLKSITIPGSVTYIGDGAFYESVEAVAYNAINCTTIKRYNAPANPVTRSSLDWLIEGDVQNFSSLEELTIGESVQVIPDYMFAQSMINQLVIPDNVVTIGSESFYECKKLASAVIGNSVASLGDRAFYGCSGLKEIISLNATPPSVGRSCFDIVPKKTCVLKVPSESLELYKAADGWRDFYNIVGIDVNAINDVKADERFDGQAYDLRGQRVSDDYKGIVVRDGKKIVNK